MKIRILILGITSTVGYRFYKLNNDYDIYGICRQWSLEKNDKIYENMNVDISFIENVINEIKPTIIINCISWVNVDGCDENPSKSERINYKFSVDIIDLIKKFNLKSIFFSSSLVYDGKNAPYSEESIASPLNQYAIAKCNVDEYIRAKLDNYLLLRPTTIFGVKENFQKDNPVNFIIQKLLCKEELYLVDDVVNNLIFEDDLVYLMYILINGDKVGEYNIGGDRPISRYELGLTICKLMGQSGKLINRTNSNTFKCSANRPLDSSVDNSKIKKAVNYTFMDLDSSLKIIISKIVGEQ